MSRGQETFLTGEPRVGGILTPDRRLSVRERPLKFVRDPEASGTQCIEFGLERDLPVSCRSQKNPDRPCGRDVVTTGRLPAFTFVEQNQLRIHFDGVCECWGLSAIEAVTEFREQRVFLGRDQFERFVCVQRSKRLDSVFASEYLLPHLFWDGHPGELSANEIETTDQHEIE